MINAAAMLLILWLIWLALAPTDVTPRALATGAAAAAAAFMIAARLGAWGRSAYAHAPRLLLFAVARARGVFRGAVATVRAALAADVTLRPALVRLKTRDASGLSQAAYADLISATPGAVVVETDDDGLLVHVLQEDRIDAAELATLETRLIGALDGKGRA